MQAESTLAIDDAGRVCVTCNQHADGWEGLIPVVSADHPSRLMLCRGDRYLAVNDANDVMTLHASMAGRVGTSRGFVDWMTRNYWMTRNSVVRCAIAEQDVT